MTKSTTNLRIGILEQESDALESLLVLSDDGDEIPFHMQFHNLQ